MKLKVGSMYITFRLSKKLVFIVLFMVFAFTVFVLALHKSEIKNNLTCSPNNEIKCGQTDSQKYTSNTQSFGQNENSSSNITPKNTNKSSPVSTSPTSPTSPKLPNAQVDPTVAWDQNYSYLENTLSSDAVNLDSIVYSCSTINPEYNSLCVPYDGAGALSTCQKLLNDTNIAKGVPGVPLVSANNYWQIALNDFYNSSQTCITNINAHKIVGSGTDVTYSVKTNYTNGTNALISLEGVITQYIQGL